MFKNFKMFILTSSLCLLALAHARPAPLAPAGCHWDYSDNKLSESFFLVCNIKTIGATDVLFKNITTAQASNVNKLKLTCTDLLFFESSLHMNTGSSLGQLRKLEELSVEFCKIRYVPATVLSPLHDLTSLSLRSFNTDWPAMTMEFHAESFRGLMELRLLDLGYNNIWILPSEVFCPLFSLESLNLTNNRIQDISDIGFSDWGKGPISPGKSCNTGLKMLDLSYNNILRLPDNGLSSLRSLEVLNIQNNLISEIGDRAFVGLNSLHALNMSSNKLVAIPPELFQSSRVIKRISISNNSLSVIAPGLLEGLDQLQILDLSTNRLGNDWVNRDTFSGLIRLVLLNLSNNRLTRLDPKLFQDLNNLQVLNLDNNNIEIISNGAFAELKNLHMLTISQNKLKVINEHVFSNLYVLQQLYLDNNVLKDIHSRSFENITYLQDLGLNGNELEVIPECIKKLRFLKSLDIGKNNITKVSNTSFEGLEELYGLRLVDNHIVNISKDTFITLPSLQVLNLASNKIENIEQNAFNSNPTLKAIRLDGNRLTDIRGVFNNLQTLGWLNISDNKLIYFDFSYIPDGLEWLDIHNNNITNLDNEFDHKKKIIKMLDVSYNQIELVDDKSIPDSIKILYLNDNKIHTVQPGTFLQKKYLEKVVISNNKLRTVELAAFTLPHINKNRQIPKFFIGNNPFICNCHMTWLQKINLWNHLRQYPRFMDLDEVTCDLVNDKYGGRTQILDVPESQFLCSYDTHCSSHCYCCDYEACDCKMTCPEGCSCYHDSNWSANVIDCSNVGYNVIPEKIPMDATELYLDGNDFKELPRHVFIGKKKLNKLYLNNSNINELDNGTFNGLYSLKVLHLENNHIVQLNGGEFSQTKHLRELYLNNNLISSIGNNTFDILLSLNVLHLQGNKIADVNKILPNPNNLEQVNVNGNIFSCDCDNLMYLETWVKRNFGNANSMFCTPDTNSSNMTVAEMMEFCRDTVIKDNTISTENQPFAYEETSSVKLNLVPLLAVVLCCVITVLLLGALIFSFRQNVRLWAHSKYGVRLFKSASVEESELDKDRLYDGYTVYSLLDDDFVSKVIAPELENTGFNMCFHYRDLQLTPESCDAIAHAAESSKRIIILVSFNFLQNEWSKLSFKNSVKNTINAIHPSLRRHRVVFILTTDVSALNVDNELQSYLNTCSVIFWGEKKFWHKMRFVMPDIANLQWNKDSLNFNHGICPNARRHPMRYTASPTAPEQWYKYAALPPQVIPPPIIGPEDDTSMLTNTTLTSQMNDVDPLNRTHSYISIDTQNYEQAYGGRPRPSTLRRPPYHSAPPLDEQGYLQPRASMHECLPQPHIVTHR